MRGRRGQKISACDSCWKRKIKCDAAQPLCSWCKHYKKSCVYKRARVQPPRQHEKVSANDSSAISTPRSQDTPINLDRDHVTAESSQHSDCALHSLIRLPDYSSVDNEWARFKAGDLVSTERLCKDRFSQKYLSMPLFPSSETFTESQLLDRLILPDRALMEKCMRLYSRSVVWAAFPVLDPALFDETLRLAYDSTHDDPTHILSAQACVIGFCVFAHLIPVGIRVCSTPKYLYYAGLINKLLPHLSEVATLDGFQACVILSLAYFCTGKLKSAAFTNSIAAHFVFYLKAHIEPECLSQSLPDNGSDLMGTHLRNLFWICYMIDKDLCLRVHQPPALSDYHCDIAPSPKYLENISIRFASDLPIETIPTSLMFPTDIKLTQIKSRVYDTLYSVPAFRKSNMELLKEIRNLDDCLETWRLGIPENLRPSLVYSRDKRMDVGSINIRTLILRLDYLHCISIVHQASNRCMKSGMNSDNTRTVIATSIALAVEASRSSLRYLEAAYHILNEGSFWVVLFYPFVASVTILCNILENPVLPSAVHDYGLLQKFPRLMRDMSTHELEPADVLHREHLEVFAKQMIHVAACAIKNVGGRLPSFDNE